jgi:hypothetical protein
MTTANTVFSGPAHVVDPIKRSAVIASGETLYPGQLVELDSTGEWQEHSTAGTGADLAIIDANVIEQKSVTEALTAGDTASAFIPQVGYTYNLVLAASQTITVGEALTSNGSGEAKSATITGATPDVVLFVAEEAVTTTGATGRIRARYVASGVKATA